MKGKWLRNTHSENGRQPNLMRKILGRKQSDNHQALNERGTRNQRKANGGVQQALRSDSDRRPFRMLTGVSMCIAGMVPRA